MLDQFNAIVSQCSALTLCRRSRPWLLYVFVAATIMTLSAETLLAQATFSVSSAATTVAKTGHTELVGTMTFAVSSGTTVAGEIEISLPVPLSNLAGIGITTTGGLAGTVITSVVPDFGLVKLTVPAGAGAGSSVTLSGMRVSVPNSGIVSVSALVSMTGNNVPGGGASVAVITKGIDPVIVDPVSDVAFTFNTAKVLIDDIGTLAFEEGYADAFSSAVGAFGRTIATQVIIRVSGVPENVSVTFPAVLTSPTGATLTTTSGGPEIVSDVSTSNLVTYVFLDSVSSPGTVDSFSLTPTLTTMGSPGSGTGFIQVTLGPIGAAPPTVDLPSTAVPRYQEQYLPVVTLAPPVTKNLAFPIQVGANTEKVAISNTTIGSALLTFRARDAAGNLLSGAEITNPVTATVLSHETTVRTLAEIFGSGASTANVASVEVESQNDRAVGSAIGGSSGGSFATHFQDAVSPMYFPFDRRDAGEIPVLSITNADQAADAVFTLIADNGSTVATVSLEVEAQGSVRGPLDQLFGIDPNNLPLSGYVNLRAPQTNFRGGLLDNPNNEPHSVPGLVATGRTRITFPFFVTGGGYTTSVVLVNSSVAVSAQVTVTAFDRGGGMISSPFVTSVGVLEKSELDLGEIFGSGTAATVGYFVLDVAKASANPFASVPQLAGMVRVETPGVSAAAPLLNDAGNQFFFTPTRSDMIEYTGLAVLNTGAASITVTVQAYASNGVSLGTENFTLAPGSTRIQLLREILTGALGQNGGFVSLTATANSMNALSFRGRLDGTELLFLRRQTAP